MLTVLGMYALWSTVFSLGKIALQFSPPLFLTAFRMSLGGALLFLWIFLFKRKDLAITWRQFGSLALLGFFSIYLTNILEFWGLQYLSAAKTCFLYSLSPFFAALFSYLHFQEKMTPKKWLGMGIGFVGCMPVVFSQSGAEEFLSISSFLTWPTLAIMAAALASIYGWVLLRLLVKDNQLSPLMANSTSMLFGGALAFIHSGFVDHWSPLPVSSQNFSSFLSSSLLICLISNIICFNLYGHMLKRFTATFLSFVGLLSPIFASLSSWLLLGEPLSWPLFLSTTVVCLGMWIVYGAELKQGYIRVERRHAVTKI